MSKLLKIALWCVALVLWAPLIPLEAQERPVVELSDDQARRLDKAGELASGDKLEEALAIYDGLLETLELDLLYLNRGRVLQRLGACQEARDAFDKVLGSPRLRGVDADTIFVPLKRYNQELERSCPGRLRVSCQQEGMVVALEGPQSTSVQCGETVTLPPGDWEVVGTLHGQTARYDAQVRGTSKVAVALSLDRQGLVGAGRVLLGQGQFKEAEAFFKEALRLKESQDTWLYIGEALLGGEKCQSAYISVQEVEGAPPSSAFSPLEVAQRLEAFREAFRATCGVPVRLRCVPAEMTVRIDGAPPQFCSPAPIFLSEGSHDITASVAVAEGEAPLTATRNVMVKSGEFNQVDLVLREDEVFGLVGWSGVLSLGLGLTSMTSALLVDRLLLVPETEDFEQKKRDGVPAPALTDELETIDSLQTVNQTLIGVGGVLLLIGGSLVLMDIFLLEDDPTQEPGRNVSVLLGPEEMLFLWSVTWQ